MFFDYNLSIGRNAGGLAIKTSSSPIAKTVNTVVGFIKGAYFSKTAGDVSLTNYTYINSNGALTTAAFTIADGFTCGATVYTNGSTFIIGKGNTVANTATFKDTDLERDLRSQGYALLGYIIIKNATGSTFTGGTTALDTSNLTVTYIDAFSSLGI